MLYQAWDLFRHLDQHLNAFASAHPIGIYALLMGIIFCETGLVVTPLLPGDSLLFAVGALAAADNSPFSLPLIIVLLCLSANCGDVLNYSIGRRVGPKIFNRESTWLLNKKHLMEAHRFYEKHGRKTIIIARFVPIVRTFAPFVAGVGEMTFPRFIGFSVSGGILWVALLTSAGYLFHGIPFVQKHFEVVVLAIVAISVMPVIFHAWKARTGEKREVEAVAASESSDGIP